MQEFVQIYRKEGEKMKTRQLEELEEMLLRVVKRISENEHATSQEVEALAEVARALAEIHNLT